ncbi:NAD-dependent protein deacetylase [Saccharospirillum impatiens]|uniref:NAD-dependent protein deacetylase n=1 Tax=Saccharospirillum impatiens TaxID=169438 RepID=UPI00040DBC17|nr:NAD-dependent protein deacetylase [Saccharospirillum impatiens]
MRATESGFRSIAMPPSSRDPRVLAVGEAAEQLADFIERHPRLFILTGAGISTGSGIPDYRDDKGGWKRSPPVQHQAFMTRYPVRQRYWGRSLIGWPVMQSAAPNEAHQALVSLERAGQVSALVTQNVDRLHQKAGSERVVDLHGRADEVVCMSCHYRCLREEVHDRSRQANPTYCGYSAETAPDGDADLELDFSQFTVLDCPQCGGILKPDVVFFGDNVPKTRVEHAMAALEASDAVLVIGSSLMVFSGYRFCRHAHQSNIPMATLNLGATRADALMDLTLNAPIGDTLACWSRSQ